MQSDFYIRWAEFPNSSVKKLVSISVKASGFLVLLTDVMGTILPIIIRADMIPCMIQNKKLFGYIKP